MIRHGSEQARLAQLAREVGLLIGNGILLQFEDQTAHVIHQIQLAVVILSESDQPQR